MNNFMQFKKENQLTRHQEYMINDLYYLNKYQWLDSNIPLNTHFESEFIDIEYSKNKNNKNEEPQYLHQSDLMNTNYLSKGFIHQFLFIGIAVGFVLITLNIIQMNSSESANLATKSLKQNERISINQDHLLAE